MTNKNEKALIYCRVSDTKQKIEGSGLESQEYRCRQHAAEHEWEVDKVFRDDVSGGGDYAKRPGMIAMLNYLERHQGQSYVVIFDDLKRLARDTMFHWQLRHAISEFGARVECLNYKFDDTPEGEFIETLFAAQGQLERKQIGRQTKQKTKARLEAGYHAFIAPVGFRYEKSKTQGKILVRDEPIASIIQEAMEGFASGRFQTKEEVRYFLESSPEYPKSASGKIGNNKAKDILTNPLYAGYVEYKPWGISLRSGQHEGMVSYETFCKIQERLHGQTHAPARADLNKDFPLRGAVSCECGNSLTAAWSKSRTGKLHPYYVCQNRKCDYKGKSIRRDVLEEEFATLLSGVTPSQNLMTIAESMFRKLWAHHEASQKLRKTRLEKDRKDIERDIEKQLDRIVDTDSDTVMKALEKRIGKLEEQKRILTEKLNTSERPFKPFDQMYRTAMDFIKNPNKIWMLGSLEEKRAVLKLVFTDRLTWDRKGMYRTPKLSLPFKHLGGDFMGKIQMVPRRGLEPPRP